MMNDKNWNPATFLPDTIPGEGLLLLHTDQLKALCFEIECGTFFQGWQVSSSWFYKTGFWERFASISTPVGLKIENNFLCIGGEDAKGRRITRYFSPTIIVEVIWYSEVQGCIEMRIKGKLK